MSRTLFAALLSLTLLAGVPAARSATDEATAETLMQQYGLWAQLGELGPQMRAGVLAAQAQSGQTPSVSELERLVKIVEAAYAPDRLRAVAARVVQADTDPAHLPAVKAWFGTGVGDRVRRLEEAAATQQTDSEQVMQQGVQRLQAMSAERRDLLADISRTVGAAEALTQMMVSTTVAAQRGLRSVLPSMPGPTPAELETALLAQRPQMLQAFAALSLASMALAYEGLGTEDLAQYLTFLKSPAGQHANEVSVRAFTAALVGAAADLGQRLPGVSDKANT